MKRTILILILAIAVIATSACQTATPTPTQPAATPTVYVRGPVTMMVAGIQVEDTSGFPTGMDLTKNVWLDYYKEALDVTLTNKWVVPTAQADDKMNLQIAANDVPDLMKVNAAQFQLLLENDMATDLTSVYEKTANESMKAIADMDKGVALKISTKGGKLYAIPFFNESVYTSSFWVRKDWLTKLGLAIPKTTEEVYAVAKAFVEQDPDGNTKKDTMGLGIQMSKSISSLEGVMTSFAAYPSKWVAGTDGKAQYSAVSPNAKKALDFLARFYMDGLLSAEFATMTDNQISESIVNGKCGLTTWPFWAPFWCLSNSKKTDPNADWVSFYATEDGSTVKLPTNKIPSAYYVIRKGFEYPEVVVEMANKFAEATIGPNKVADTEKFVQGPAGENFWQFAQVYFWAPINQDIEGFVTALEKKDKTLCPALRRGDFDGALNYINTGDVAGYASWLSFGPESQYLANIKLLQAGSVEDGVYFGTGTPTMTSVGADLDKILLQGYAKYISGDAAVTYESIVNEWLAAGGQTITNEVNTEIAASK